MSWKRAFLVQARSDQAILDRLNHPSVEYCHRLHYLQMLTEKLSKAMLSNFRNPIPPAPTHTAFVKMLRNLRGRPEIRRRLGFRDTQAFANYIDSLLPLCHRIESLAPSISGVTKPSPEYPWQDAATAKVMAPAEYEFREFDPNNPKMQKIATLISELLSIEAQSRS